MPGNQTVEHGRSIKWARQWSLGPSNLDYYFNGGMFKLNKQHKIVVMLIADLVTDQFNFGAKYLSQ